MLNRVTFAFFATDIKATAVQDGRFRFNSSVYIIQMALKDLKLYSYRAEADYGTLLPERTY